MIGAHCVWASDNKLIVLSRIPHPEVRVGQPHLLRFLEAVGRLSDHLSYQDRGGASAKLCGVRHSRREGVRTDDDEQMPPPVEARKVADGFNEVSEPEGVVAAAIFTHVDHQLVRARPLDKRQEIGCPCRETIVAAEAAVDRARLRQILAPERLIGVLEIQWPGTKHRGPGTSVGVIHWYCVGIETELLPGVVRQGQGHRVPRGCETEPVQDHAHAEEAFGARLPQRPVFIPGCECQKPLHHQCDRPVLER